LLFVYYFTHRENRKAFFFALIAIGVHLSAVLTIIVSVGARFVKIWHSCVLLAGTSAMAILGLGIHNIPLVAPMDRLSSYVEGHDRYQVGFSGTYWLYNMLISVYFIVMNSRIKDPYYRHLGKMFILLSSGYFLSFHVGYS